MTTPVRTTLVLLNALRLAPGAAPLAADVPKPKNNLILFLIDDLGWKDPGCQGSAFYRTPNMNGLADGAASRTRMRRARCVRPPVPRC